MATESSTLRPLITSSTRRTLRGAIFTFFPLASTSTLAPPYRSCALRAPSVAAEGTGKGELAQAVPHQVLRDEDRHVTAAVVHGDRNAYHLRHDHAGTRPGADDAASVRARGNLHLLQQLCIDERTLFQ